MPREGKFGDDTWGDASRYAGDAGAWCCLSGDEDLGLMHVPLSAVRSTRFRRWSGKVWMAPNEAVPRDHPLLLALDLQPLRRRR